MLQLFSLVAANILLDPSRSLVIRENASYTNSARNVEADGINVNVDVKPDDQVRSRVEIGCLETSTQKKCFLAFLIILSLALFSGCVSLILNLSTAPGARLKDATPAFFDISRSLAPIACAEFHLKEKYKTCEFSFQSRYSSGFKRNDTVAGRLYIPLDPKSKDGFIVLPGSGENISSFFFAETLARLGFTTVRLYAGFRPLPHKFVKRATQTANAEEALTSIGVFFRSAMRQRVVDVIRIADFLETTQGTARFHVVGSSLGGIVANLFAAIDPRVESLMMVISSANLAQIASTEGSLLRRIFRDQFRISKEDLYQKLKKELEIVEPLTYKDRLPHKILLVSGFFDIAGLVDTVIPFSATIETWRAYGHPEWIIIGTGHFTSIITLLPLWIEFPYIHHILFTALQPYGSHILVEHFLPLAFR